MKYIFSLLLIAATFGANAQNSTYRFANQPGNNSYSFLNFNSATIADAAGSTTDTIGLRPFCATSYYNLTVTDSVNIRFASIAAAHKADQLVLNWTKGTGAGVLYLSTDFVVSTGTNRIVLTASKKGLLTFFFDGTKWVEIDRNANY